MRVVCKWNTKCSECGIAIEAGEDVWLTTSIDGEKEKLCYDCAEMYGWICDCTNDKKPEHPTCWDCRVAEQKRNGTLCACGRYKQAKYPTCYACKQKVAH
jgi:hypothetical protein